jgi:hypothetical protein
LAACLVLAGCAGSDAGPAATPSTSAAPPSVTVDTGSIQGLVLSEDQLPIPGAQVAIVETQANTKTDPEGVFVFNDLAPGKYRLIAQRLGYSSAARSVDVAAQEVLEVKLTLAAIEVKDEPIRDLKILDGIVQCSVSVFTPIHPCGGVTGDDKDSWIFSIDKNYTFKEGVFELQWKATGPGDVGKEMELEVCDDLNREYLCTFGGTTSEYYEFAAGPSPQTLHLTNMPKDKTQFLTGAGAAFEQPPLVQQKFTIYMTLCYIEACGDEYTALAPAS